MRLPGLQYDSPNHFSFRQRLVLAAGIPLGAAIFKTLFHSGALEHRGGERFFELTRRGPVIIASWHEAIAAALYCYRNRGYHTLTSYSYDGEVAARVARAFGTEAVRGSSSRGGSRALRDLSYVLDHVGVAGITIDGPKGPRRQSKPGAAMLAVRTGAVIVPHAFVITPCRRLRSWDRLMLPKWGARTICQVGEPIEPPTRPQAGAAKALTLELDRQLNLLQEQLDAEFGLDAPELPGAKPKV